MPCSAHLLAFAALLSGCSLVYSGDAYTFGDVGIDGAVDSATGDARDSSLDAPDAQDAQDAEDAEDAPPVDSGPPLGEVTALLGSGTHSCAIFGGDQVGCWGTNNLGADPAVGTRFAFVPGIYLGGDVGLAHTCAIEVAGTMRCWGVNDQGQLGLGDTNPRGSPTDVTRSADFSHVSAGETHTCAIELGEQVVCTGTGPGFTNGTAMPVGDGTFQTVIDEMLPLQANQIASGRRFSCAIHASRNQLVCWGDLTPFGRESSSGPVELSSSALFPDGLSTLCAGDAHICVIEAVTNRAHCWGANESGQIGSTTLGNQTTPNRILNEAMAIACGAGHTCAIDDGGELFCWGTDTDGELGNGTLAALPGSRARVDVPASRRFTQVKSGGPRSHTTCAIRDDATLWCWGRNMLGQANPNTGTARLIEDAPVQVIPPS